MKTVFLFNADAQKFGGSYGYPIMKMIVEAEILQETDRNMIISLGDVLTYGRLNTLQQLQSVYVPHSWDRRKIDALEAIHNKGTVYCWVIRNIPKTLAEKLHQKLFPEESYLGAIDLNYAYLPHFAFFANGLIQRCRLHNKRCSIFYTMSDKEEAHDVAYEEVFGNAGYTVDYEDSGGRHTIFDNYYDSIEHHQRIEHFSKFFIHKLNWNLDDISEMNLNLEELHPYLFNILYASSRALEGAEVKEQLSQAYLSGRRFIEHIANFLYPPKDCPHKGIDGEEHSVKQDNYINRIAAYLENTLGKVNALDQVSLKKYGKKTSTLYKEFCRGLHKPFADEEGFEDELLRCQQAISDLGNWISKIIGIDPASIRRPYLAYEEEILKLFTNKEAT